MKTFIDDHREAYGVAPICKALPIVSSSGCCAGWDCVA
jgi:hypothetical protein